MAVGSDLGRQQNINTMGGVLQPVYAVPGAWRAQILAIEAATHAEAAHEPGPGGAAAASVFMVDRFNCADECLSLAHTCTFPLKQ